MKYLGKNGLRVEDDGVWHEGNFDPDSKVDKVSGKGLSDENYTLAEKNKLAGIATGATKNDTDANLKNRANHTGTQPSSTISDFASTVRNTVLTGLSTATNAAITATDTILSALGKLQKQISDNLSTLTNHISNKNNPHGTTKSHVGLGNVDNTSDLDKPISTAVQSALDDKLDKDITEITLGRYKLIYNETTSSLDIEVIA